MSDYPFVRGRAGLEQDGRSVNKRLVYAVVAVIIIIIVIFALWEFVVRDYLADAGIEEEYEIAFWLGGEKVEPVTMSQLETLHTVSYEDTFTTNESGAVDKGPLVMDVVLLMVNESYLTNSTNILILSALTGEERTLSWGDISNISNSYILDFTNQGTTKFTSPNTQKEDRVRHVTEIRVGV